MPMGAIPRLFMAVAQAFGSDMGIPNELESIAILRRPSIQTRRENVISISFGKAIQLRVSLHNIIINEGITGSCQM